MKIKAINRRNFLSNTTKGTLMAAVGSSGMASFLASCSTSSKIAMGSNLKTGFTQQPLPYAYNALENVIDAQTMELHYSKHGAAYSKALAEAIAAEGVASAASVEDILSSMNKYSTKMRNNAGGHYNHEMFWQSMRPKSANNKPVGSLLAAIEKQFGTFDAFSTQFSDAAKTRFGSGWAWLFVAADKTLKIGSTPNQDNPVMSTADLKGFPLLGLDVWEHAYYLKYQNKRADYIKNWWDIVNWSYVQKRFDAI